jgi:hypothetical protein
VSYPPPPGPPSGPPNQPSQNSGWQQQPYQPHGGQPQGGPYQPQGGNWQTAPPYGGPPRKDRAGLIVVVIAILLVFVLGVGGFVAYNLTSGSSDGGTAPAPAPSSVPIEPTPTDETPTGLPTAMPSPTQPPKPPTQPPTKAPTQPVPSKPVGGKGTKTAAIALAGKFVGLLNAGNSAAATALGCADTKAMIPTLISVWIKAPTSLKLGDVALGQDPYIISMSGTTGGKKMDGMVIVQGSCVRVFQLSPA